MTLLNAPWALDGARIPSRLARTASYIESGGAEGVVGVSDLKVRPLDVNGVGIQIDEGSALLLNRYQRNPNQSYAIVNDGLTLIDASAMPPAVPSGRSHLVCVTIGDPEFSAAGHPWMPSTPIPAELRESFQYVRFFIIPNVPAGTTHFRQLNRSYPAYALARLDVPANTATITSSMIVDLRKVARPRQEIFVDVKDITVQDMLPADHSWYAGPSGQGFGNWKWTVDVPEWATQVTLDAWLAGIVHELQGGGWFRLKIMESGQTTLPTWKRLGAATSSAWNDTFEVPIASDLPLAANLRGTQITVIVEGKQAEGAQGGLQGPAFARVSGFSAQQAAGNDGVSSARLQATFREIAV